PETAEDSPAKSGSTTPFLPFPCAFPLSEPRNGRDLSRRLPNAGCANGPLRLSVRIQRAASAGCPPEYRTIPAARLRPAARAESLNPARAAADSFRKSVRASRGENPIAARQFPAARCAESTWRAHSFWEAFAPVF